MSKEPANQSEKQSPMERVSAFIVDKRKAFYLLYIGVAIFCVFSSGWTAVNDDLTSYLPDTTETRQGLTIMDEEFVTFGTSRIMVDNISWRQAERLAEQARAIPERRRPAVHHLQGGRRRPGEPQGPGQR